MGNQAFVPNTVKSFRNIEAQKTAELPSPKRFMSIFCTSQELGLSGMTGSESMLFGNNYIIPVAEIAQALKENKFINFGKAR